MTLYGYARVSVREPEDKNLDLQVERLVRAGCSLGNIRAEEASGARNDRGGLLELLDLVVANQVRLWLFVLTYNLGNFMRRLVLPEERLVLPEERLVLPEERLVLPEERLVLPEDMKHWTLSSLQTRLIKTGGRLVRHARRLVFQLAGVLVTREMLTGILERISRLRLAPG